jgi:hypothetical protein
MKDKNSSSLCIGFDETSNGFHLPHPPFMVVTGVLGNENSCANSYPCSNKANRRFFGEKPTSPGKVARYARIYLREFPNFRYSIIPKPQEFRKPYSINLIEAQAISAISLRFLNDFRLVESTPIYVHQIGGPTTSEFVEREVSNTLVYAGISRPNVKVVLSSKEEKQKGVIRCADMTGYYLAALRFLVGKKEWQFRSRQVPIASLDNLIQERVKEQEVGL